MSTKHPFILLMQHAEDFAYKNADYVISMLPKTKEYMASRGLDLKKWYYVPNGFSKKQWTTSVALNIETDTQINKLKKQFDFLLAYTGTLGLANNIDILLDASPYLPNNVAIVLMGEGPDKKRLKNRIKNEELKACFVFDSIQKDEIPSFLSKMDILYIGLKSEPLFRFGISPNKMIDYMMAGKPVIQAINAGNNMVKDASCGISIQPDNSQAIVDAVIQLTSCSETELLKMGKNGQQYAFKHHDYQQLAKYFLDIVS
jgi:glycosyltransferase involved in cell wall biosynthesis